MSFRFTILVFHTKKINIPWDRKIPDEEEVSFAFQAVQKHSAYSMNRSLRVFVNLKIIFWYIWEETIFLKREVECGKISNS